MEYMLKILLYKIYYTTAVISCRFIVMYIEDQKTVLFRKLQ